MTETSSPVPGNRRLVFKDHFITARDCESILFELDHTYWSPSKVVHPCSHEMMSSLSEVRVSETAHQEWFSDKLTTILKRIENRLKKDFGVDPLHLEPWQATRYKRGGKFDFHMDCGHWKNSPSGERKRTLLLYLNTPERGGQTSFRALNTSISAVAGRIVVWDNLLPDGNCNHLMIHSASPVKKGNKVILVTWEREFRHKTI